MRNIVGISALAGFVSLMAGLFSRVHVAALFLRVVLSIAFSIGLFLLLRFIFRNYLSGTRSEEKTRGRNIDVVVGDERSDPEAFAAEARVSDDIVEEEFREEDYQSKELSKIKKSDPELMANAIRTALHTDEERDKHA